MRPTVLIRLVYLVLWVFFVPFILLLNWGEDRKNPALREKGGTDPRKAIAVRRAPTSRRRYKEHLCQRP